LSAEMMAGKLARGTDFFMSHSLQLQPRALALAADWRYGKSREVTLTKTVSRGRLRNKRDKVLFFIGLDKDLGRV
jgi:hypothetical protein